MGKSVKFVLATAAVLALAYPAASWYCGKELESLLDKQYALIGDNYPGAKVVQRSYDRGIFSSSETTLIEYEIPAEILQSEEAIRFTLTAQSRVEHGPLPGLRQPALAHFESEISFTGSPFLPTIPLKLSGTYYNYDGSSSGDLNIPSWRFNLPERPDGEAKVEAIFSGLNMQVKSAADMSDYTVYGKTESLEIVSNKARFAIAGIDFESSQARLFDDAPFFYIGKSLVKAERISLEVLGSDSAVKLALDGLIINSDVPVSGDFLDFKAKFTAQRADINAEEYGPIHYDFSINHLHSRALADFVGEFSALSTLDIDLSERRDKMAAYLSVLLNHHPEYKLDRLSFGSAHGETALSLNVGLSETQEMGVIHLNPLALLDKLVLTGEVSVPQPLLRSWIGNKGEHRLQNFEQTVDKMLEQGYVVRGGEQLRSKIAFRNGQFTANDIPVL